MRHVWPIQKLYEFAQTAQALPSADLKASQIAGATNPQELADIVYDSLEKANQAGSILGRIKFAEFINFQSGFDLTRSIYHDPFEAVNLAHRRMIAQRARGPLRSARTADVQFDSSGKGFIATSNTNSVDDFFKSLNLSQPKRGPLGSGTIFGSADESKIRQLETEIRGLTDMSSGTNELGRVNLGALPFAQRDIYRRELSRAYGLNDLPNLYGRPSFVRPPLDKYGRPDARAYAGYEFTRADMRTNESFGMTVESQMSRQFRPYRASTSYNNLSDVFPISGTMGDLSHFQRLHAQRLSGLRETGSYALFDVETPSLDPKHGIRQLSARFYNESGEEVIGESMNVHFRSPTMDLGYYGKSSFEDVARRMGGTFIEDANVGASLKEFFVKANKYNSLVAHNASFDIARLQAMLDDPRVSPLMQSDQEFRDAVNKFFTTARGGSLVDTLAHSRMMIGHGVNVAGEFAKDEAKPFSLENIVLQTSFLDDVVRNSSDKAATIRQIRGSVERLHSGEVDTWLTHNLLEQLKRSYNGEDVLRPMADVSQVGASIFSTQEERAAFRGAIAKGGAIIPVGNVHDASMLSDKYKEFMGDKLDLVGRPTTHLEQMIMHTRNIGALNGQADALQAMNADIQYGDIVHPVDWALTQSHLQDLNIPFSGLSMPERSLAQAMGAMGGGKTGEIIPGSKDITELRNRLSSTLGVGSWEETQAAKVFPGSGIAALPREMIKELEKLQYSPGRSVLDTGLSSGTRQFGSISRFETRAGEKGAGLYLKPFGTNVTYDQIQERLSIIRPQIERMAAEGRYGLTPESVNSVMAALSNTTSTAGIQIGANFDAGALHQALERFGEQVSTSKPRYLTAIGDTGTAGRIHTYGMFSTVADQYKDITMAKNIESNVKSAEQLFSTSVDSAQIDKVLQTARILGGVPHGRAATVAANYEKYIEPHLNVRNAGLVALASAGYYIVKKRKENRKYDEAITQQGFETARDDLGLPRVGTPQNSLATAGLVQQLDYQKIGHTQMSSSKNNKLFSGVM